MSELLTKIGLEIHVQLKTKSKMFCGCDNNAEGKKPNTVVCPVCLGLPGTLPVANKQAIEWTIKAGLALNCKIRPISKFDRKHYFYPDLPKGYQISQYDEPFCEGGSLEVDGQTVRLNRIHLEEDAGKLIHAGGKSLVDLNRAGTPLMEIVTEPDITSPKQAGDFLRELQKIVRDVVEVSEASMEKGHMRCDANISVTERQSDPSASLGAGEERGTRMSPIIEIKNINSFRFVEKALTLVEEKLKEECDSWPEKNTKATWGYDSVNNKVYLQRVKEEASDYRYFPEPDLPPIDTSAFDLESLKSQIKVSATETINHLTELGIPEADAKVLAENKDKGKAFEALRPEISTEILPVLAKAIVHDYFGFSLKALKSDKISEFTKAVTALNEGKLLKSTFAYVAKAIQEGKSFDDASEEITGAGVEGDSLDKLIENILSQNPAEVERYKKGEQQLFGFFMGKVMKETGGKANPQEINKILREKL